MKPPSVYACVVFLLFWSTIQSQSVPTTNTQNTTNQTEDTDLDPRTGCPAKTKSVIRANGTQVPSTFIQFTQISYLTETINDRGALVVLYFVLAYLVFAEGSIGIFMILKKVSSHADIVHSWQVSFMEFREKLIIRYYSSKIAFIWEMTLLTLSFVSCGIFLYITVMIADSCAYGDPIQIRAMGRIPTDDVISEQWILISEFIISLVFLGGYIRDFAIAKEQWIFVINPFSIANMLTIISGIASLASGKYIWYFLNLRFLQIYRSMTYLRKYGWAPLSNGRRADLSFLIVTIASFIFCAAGFIFVAENRVTSTDGFFTSIADSLYFIVITLTTVGYGDFYPKSILGRLIVIATIIGAITVLPPKLAALAFRSKDFARVEFNTDHIILVSEETGENVNTFIQQFYHEDHYDRNISIAIVTKSLTPGTKEFLHNPNYQGRVCVIHGDFSSTADMSRAEARKAKAVFFLSRAPVGKGQTEKPSEQFYRDLKTILSALSLKNLTARQNPDLKIIAQILTQSHKETALDRGIDHVVCTSDLKMSCIAQAVVHTGISTVIANLITAITARPLKNYRNEWLADYEYSLGHEIYSEKFPQKFYRWDFSSVVEHVYKESAGQVALIGLTMIDKKDDTKRILINPSSKSISAKFSGIFVAQDEATLRKTLATVLSEEKIKSVFSKKEKLCKKIRRIVINTDEVQEPSPTSVQILMNREIKLTKNDHIVIIGEMNFDIVLLLQKLCHRRKDRNRTWNSRVPFKNIVLFGRELCDSVRHSIEELNIPQKIYFVSGSALTIADLRRAYVEDAVKIVILNNGEVFDEKMPAIYGDSQVICTFHLLCHMQISVSNVIAVIEYPENLRLLSVSYDLNSSKKKTELKALKEHLNAGPLRNNFYASGNAVLPSLLNSLLCQSFYNENSIEIVETLLQSNCITVKETKSEFGTFSDAFLYYLNKKRRVVLGVIRQNITAKNTCVLTLPKRDLALLKEDKLIVFNSDF